MFIACICDISDIQTNIEKFDEKKRINETIKR